MEYNKDVNINELINGIMDVIVPYKAILTTKNRKYIEFIKKCVTSSIDYLIENGFVDKLNELKYIAYNKSFEMNSKIIDRTLELSDKVNDYIKQKHFTPKENRIFYDNKNKLIVQLYNYSNRIIDEWTEDRDGELFVCYELKSFDDSKHYVFHQPYKNVEHLYRRKVKRDALLSRQIPYHRFSGRIYTNTEEEIKEYKSMMYLFTIYTMIIYHRLNYRHYDLNI